MATLTFDKDTQIMEVALPDTEITIQEIVDQIRDFEDNPSPDNTGGMDIPHILSAGGKEPLTDTTWVGITITLIDWTIKFANRGGPGWITCNIVGGNIVAYDTGISEYVSPITPGTYVNTNITASSSATIAEGTGGSTPSAIADAVWDEPMAGHTTAGTFGEWVKNKLLDVGKFLGLKDV